MLWLLLPVLLLVYLLYRARRPKVRPWAGVWLWQRGRRRRFRPRLDLRLLLLLLAAALMVLALEDPPLGPSPMVFVVDASASMAAREGARTRLDLAKEGLLPLLERASEAVVVRAGEEPEAFGPAPGVALRGALLALEAKDREARLEEAIALGRRLLRAPVVVATDRPPPPGVEGYLGVGTPQENLGIVAVDQGFLSLGNSAGRPLTARVEVAGEVREVRVPPGGYAPLEGLPPTFSARLLNGGALDLDDEAAFGLRRLGADYPPLPALERLFRLLGAVPGDEVRVRIGVPEGTPERPTLYLAPSGGPPISVLLTTPHPLLEGVSLLGERLPPPPRPPASWEPLAEGEESQGLLYFAEGGLYLPPLEAIQDRPLFPLLIYNFLKPYREVRAGLLAPEETLLPTPGASFLPQSPGGAGRFLALLAALVLLLEAVRSLLRPRAQPQV
ncbi:vWA domain-containing protein [Thermus thermamylovorans]|uniref:VWA domain-containing protein n=1 Tax=Thermus thermamylovorans TaxID=2509362 RepID=A0A4Q9AYM2_9DEIN|nr:VWA domain-containing protein [Thermus thermamylovorans]TBH16520.1 VWA domain-containing protein [Thermus thermamylovorans]